MRFNFYSIKIFSIFIGFISINLFFAANEAKAQASGGISVMPHRLEVVIPPGTEKTVGVAVDYTRDAPEIKLPIARLIARLQDWSLQPNGQLKTAAPGTLPRSAASWTTFGPAEFSLAADQRQILRFTISVPKDTPPGDYYLACYIENRVPPPPPTEGKLQLNVLFRYYSMIYVMVPGLTTDGKLLALDSKVVNGVPVISPKLANEGNSRLRPQHTVEIRGADDKVMFSSPMVEALVVLGGHSWEMPIPIAVELPAGNYKLAYTVDFGDRKALQRATTAFQITESDIAARKKAADASLAKNNPVSTAPTNQPPTETAQPKETSSTPNTNLPVSTSAKDSESKSKNLPNTPSLNQTTKKFPPN